MTLHDQLHELTDEVGHAPPPPDLWDRGRRWQRSRRLGTAGVLAAACVLAVALGSLAWVRATPAPAPASYDGRPALPDRLHVPSRWLPEGDLHAPLVALRTIGHGAWWWHREAVVGISATTGEYRVLPLPDLADDGGASLSPDGSRVAYWLAGEPTGDPNTQFGQSETVTGVAVYDAVTGEVRRAPIETEHGLMVDTPPVWADSETLVISFNQFRAGDHGSDMKQSSGTFAPVLVWSMAATAPHRWAAIGKSPAFLAAGNGTVLVDGPGRYDELHDVHTGRARRLGLAGPMGSIGPALSSVTLSPGGRVAVVGGGALPQKSPNRVTIGRIPATGDEVSQRVVPGSERTFQTLGWRGERTLVVVGRVGRGWEHGAMTALDTRTGERERLVRMPALLEGTNWEWADDLLGAPVVPARKPASPLDPRVLWIGSGLLVVGTFLGLRRWRSRVRP